ncbi:MAG: glycosyltransferase family 39 protein [Anaerolineae bacterium]|nr:glycosyltransferase family 39 protein [Anaerolineae bacterium]
METERPLDVLLVLLGLFLVALGQVYFIWLPRYVWDGVLFCALGAFLWAVALRRAQGALHPGPSRLRRLLAKAADHPFKSGLLTLSALLALAAGVGARRAPPEADFSPYLRAWVFGLLLYLLALFPRRPVPCNIRPVTLLPMFFLLLAAFLVRAVALDEVPANFGGDEGTQALEALRLLGPPLKDPFATGWYSVPNLSFVIAGLGMRFFGATVSGVRTLSALAGTATVLATFLLARTLAGERVGWAAAALVAFGHYAIHFSRLASNQIGDALVGALSLYFLIQGTEGEEDRRPLYMGLTGVILGLGWYLYFGARLATVVVGLYLVGRSLTGKSPFGGQGTVLAALAFGFALTVWPLALYYFAHPVDFFSRYNQVSIFASGWLRQEMALTGRSALSLLLEQFWKSISAFHVTPDPTFWYRPGVPLLDPLSGILFILGLTAVWGKVHRAVRCRQGCRLLLFLWFWSVVLLGWTLTENPPSSQRGVGAIPVVALLTAVGLVELASLPRSDTGKKVVLWGLLGAIIIVNLFFYFAIYTPRRVYGNPTAEVADVLCDVLEARKDLPPVYFDGAPFMYWDFGAIAFRLRGVTGRDFSAEEIPELDISRGALFVVLAEKREDLDLLRVVFPDGQEAAFYSSADGRLLFTLYEVAGP